LLLLETFIAGGLFSFKTDLVTSFLVPLTLVFLLEAFRILNMHVKGVVHKALELDS
jgi:hypothetical protein